MATPGLPAMLARQLVSKLAGGAPQAPQAPMGAPQGAGAQAGDQVARQLSELQGADPGAISQALQQVKSILVPLYVRSAYTIAGVARNVAQAQKYIDNAISEAEKAMATASTVQPPIANNASIPNPQGPGLQDFASGGGA